MKTLSYWSSEADEMMGKLHSSSNGLSQIAAQEALEQVGLNHIRPKEQVTALGLFLNQFKSPIVLILIFATFLSAFLKDGRCHHHSPDCVG
jgi:Mg2+-importing ATPase